MALLSLSHVTHHYEGPLILDDVSIEVEKGRKIGVIGANGTGKSTLLKIMRGEIEPASGEVFRQRRLRTAYQAQELVRPAGTTVMDEMRSLFAEELSRERRLRELEELLATDADGRDRLLEEYGELQEEHHAAQGYSVEQRIASVLTGLGLPETAWSQPLEGFSGGEKNIIGLARVLLSEPDLILLDEPSNHLDMDGLEWFIRWLRSSKATVVMVSHNRHLLDLTVAEIWEVGDARVACWTGDYTDYQGQKADALALQERQYKNQQRLIKRLEFQARRLRDMARAYDDPGQAKRAKAMLRRVEQMDKVERPDETERHFKATFGGSDRHGVIALTVEDFSFGYGERILFDRASIEIGFGERVCLVGPNGSGKSTLVRSILDDGSWENPVVRLGKSVRVGDYNQIHQEVMTPSTSLVDWIMERTGMLYQPATELLHRFLFTRDDLDRDIETLSGGEKSRLQIARLVQQDVNFLILDEPTNHLDIPSCEQLERMLEDFAGTLLIISHDRYFLDRLVDVVVEVRDRRLVRHQGSFAEWWETRHREAQARGGATLTLHSQKEAGQGRKDETKQRREERKAEQRDRRRLAKQVSTLEARIAELETRKSTLSQDLEQAYQDGRTAAAPDLARDLENVTSELQKLYADWEDLAPQLDA